MTDQLAAIRSASGWRVEIGPENGDGECRDLTGVTSVSLETEPTVTEEILALVEARTKAIQPMTVVLYGDTTRLRMALESMVNLGHDLACIFRKFKTVQRATMTERERKRMDNQARIDRAYQRQAAAIAAKMSAPKAPPAKKPYRRGEWVWPPPPRRVSVVNPQPKGNGLPDLPSRRATSGTVKIARDAKGRGRVRTK